MLFIDIIYNVCCMFYTKSSAKCSQYGNGYIRSYISESKNHCRNIAEIKKKQ